MNYQFGLLNSLPLPLVFDGEKKYCSCGELKFSLLSVQILKSENSGCYVHKAVNVKRPERCLI